MGLLRKIVHYLVGKYKFGSYVKFKFSSNIGINSKFEGMNQVHSHTEFSGILGYGSYIGPFSSINGSIGRFVSIGPYVRCNSGKHPYSYPYVSTAPCFFSLNPHHFQNGSTFATEQCFDEFSYQDKYNNYSVKIGNDCWIGEGVFLVGGIEVSDGAVILAHAVVTKNVPPYAIVGGVPAKIIKYRYNEMDIKFLLEVKWWNNTPSWFKDNWRLLLDIEKLKKYYKY